MELTGSLVRVGVGAGNSIVPGSHVLVPWVVVDVPRSERSGASKPLRMASGGACFMQLAGRSVGQAERWYSLMSSARIRRRPIWSIGTGSGASRSTAFGARWPGVRCGRRVVQCSTWGLGRRGSGRRRVGCVPPGTRRPAWRRPAWRRPRCEALRIWRSAYQRVRWRRVGEGPLDQRSRGLRGPVGPGLRRRKMPSAIRPLVSGG